MAHKGSQPKRRRTGKAAAAEEGETHDRQEETLLDEETLAAEEAPSLASSSTGSQLVPHSNLNAGAIKRFKSHATYNAANAKDEETRIYASKALEVYAGADGETKGKILQSFKTDKSYKFISGYVESHTETEKISNKTAGGWMTKFTWASLNDVPTHDKELYDALCNAAVEGLDEKDHDNPAFRKLGHKLYNFPLFAVGAQVMDSVTQSDKVFKSELALNAANMEVKAGLKENAARIKVEFPHFIELQREMKILESGQRALQKSVNVARQAVTRIAFFKKNTPNHNLTDKFDSFSTGFDRTMDMEMDILGLLRECKNVEKEDEAKVGEIKERVDLTIKNVQAAVAALDESRKLTLKLLD